MRKNIGRFFILCAIVLLISGCDILGWRAYTSAEGGFSVRLPAEPKGQKIILDTGVGRTYLNIYILNRKDDNFVYSIGYVDYPASLFQLKNADKILDDGRDGAVKNIKGKLISESKISINKNPGREVTIEATAGDAVLRAKFFLVGQRMYQLMVTTSKKKSKSYQILKFLDSFELIGKKSK
jgi:hypothetical protein